VDTTQCTINGPNVDHNVVAHDAYNKIPRTVSLQQDERISADTAM